MGDGNTSAITNWRRFERGRYVAVAPWGALLEVERRRSEGAEPSGWFLFGELPNGVVIGGVWMGGRMQEALVNAEEWVTARAERQ